MRYWPARTAAAPDLGVFVNRVQRRRQIAGWALAIGSFAVFAGFAASVAAREPAVAFEALAPLIFPALLAAVIVYLIVRPDPSAPGGVWEVDSAGRPVRFVGTHAPPEVADDPGVDAAQFSAAIRARAGGD